MDGKEEGEKVKLGNRSLMEGGRKKGKNGPCE